MLLPPHVDSGLNEALKPVALKKTGLIKQLANIAQTFGCPADIWIWTDFLIGPVNLMHQES